MRYQIRSAGACSSSSRRRLISATDKASSGGRPNITPSARMLPSWMPSAPGTRKAAVRTAWPMLSITRASAKPISAPSTCRADFMLGSYIPYTTNLPLERAIEDDVLLVHTWEGQPLPREHGGPCRMITPKVYAWKGTKWIKIEFLAADQKGFWEVRGYSNSAEPWFNDRYSQKLEARD